MHRTRSYIHSFAIVLAAIAVTSSAARGEETTSLSMDKAVEAEAFEHKRGTAALNAIGIAKKFGAAAIPEWEKYLDHEDWRTRTSARFGIAQVGRDSEDPDLRRELLTKIVRSSLDDPLMDGKIAHLFGFRPGDASDEVRGLLLERLNVPGEGESALRYEAAVIQAIGRLKIREAIPRLKELRTLEPVDGNERNPFRGRYAMLALARMGDLNAIRDAIATLEAIEDGERRASSLGHLSIIPHPEVVEHLKKYLFSDVVYPTDHADLLPVREQDYAYWSLISMLEVPEGVTYTNFREWFAEQTTYTFK